jgi:cytochrome P450
VVQKLECHIQDIANQLIDSFIASGNAELVSQYAFILPVTVIAELLGVPSSDRERFKNWSTQITAGFRGSFCPVLTMRSLAANYGLSDYLKQIIRNKRAQPKDDLISALVEVQSHGDGRLSGKELLANSLLLLLAGHETTVNLIGNAIYNLLKDPAQLQLLRARPELINCAVEEILRYDPPVHFVRRIAYKPIELANQQIKKDDAMTILLAACNRDPRSFDRPDTMDITRQDNRHLSFGSGIHFCLGAELARAEARIAISTLLRRLKDLRLSEGQDVIYKGPFLLRGLQRLDVAFSAV